MQARNDDDIILSSFLQVYINVNVVVLYCTVSFKMNAVVFCPLLLLGAQYSTKAIQNVGGVVSVPVNFS